jgi:hypothetical protein
VPTSRFVFILDDLELFFLIINQWSMHIYSSNILCTQVKLGKVIIKMHTKSSKIKVAFKNLHALCVVKLILGLLYSLPVLDYVHALIKIAQSRNVFMCDFVEHQVGPTRIISTLL